MAVPTGRQGRVEANRAVALVAVLVVVMGAAVHGLASECYPVRPDSDAAERKPRIAHYLGS